MNLTPEPLDAAAFAPFGTVIAFDEMIARHVNEDTALRADTAALFDHAPGTTPVLALYRVEPQRASLSLTLFERHPRSTQSFVALSLHRFLVVVAPSGQDGLPDVTRARAFIGCGGTGLSYRRDRWHTPVRALGPGGDLLMFTAEGGDGRDCIEYRLIAPLTIRSTDAFIEGPFNHGA